MNSSLLTKLQDCSKLINKPLSTGIIKDSSLVQEQKEIIEDIESPILSLNSQINLILNNLKQENVSAIVESQPLLKKKTWKDKFNSLQEPILTTKLLKTLDQVSTLKEKDLTPFWTLQSKEISKNLWLPTKIDSVDSVLNSMRESSTNTQMGKSWFSIKNKLPLQKNSQMTSFKSSLFSLTDSMDLEATPSKTKSKKKSLRTLKIRLFPTKDQVQELDTCLEQFRWYYNATIAIMNKENTPEQLLNKKEWSNITIRDKIRHYEYVEQLTPDGKIQKDFIHNEDNEEPPKPGWWDKVHSRIPRGASDKYTSSLNSGITNLRNKNISSFKMHFKTKKDPTRYMHFEDKSFPAFIRKIESKYWFRTKERKRKYVSFEDIFKNTTQKGIEVIHDKINNKYFLHYPIEYDWFPSDDLRNENQEALNINKDRIISLDPGVRKFLVGYDPTGKSVFIGEDAQKHLIPLLLEIDLLETNSYNKWKKIKNLVNELHWKTISFLIKNYDIILLPDFRVSEMIRSNKLGRMTKRLMCMFSFFSFKEKLKYKCKIHGKKLIIVDESYTSCTCGSCGVINRELKGSEVFECSSCGIKMDRDASGSRNILLKNVKLKVDIKSKTK